MRERQNPGEKRRGGGGVEVVVGVEEVWSCSVGRGPLLAVAVRANCN